MVAIVVPSSVYLSSSSLALKFFVIIAFDYESKKSQNKNNSMSIFQFLIRFDSFTSACFFVAIGFNLKMIMKNQQCKVFVSNECDKKVSADIAHSKMQAAHIFRLYYFYNLNNGEFIYCVRYLIAWCVSKCASIMLN